MPTVFAADSHQPAFARHQHGVQRAYLDTVAAVYALAHIPYRQPVNKGERLFLTSSYTQLAAVAQLLDKFRLYRSLEAQVGFS